MNLHRFHLHLLLAVAALAGCDHGHPHGEGDHGHAHAEDDDHGHAHDDDDHEHGEHGEHGHAHDDDDHDHAQDDDHGHPHGEEDDHGHGHGAHDGAAEVVTLWGDATQLFVEFPALVAGEPSPFAAHLTRLTDHRAIGTGTVTVELAGSGGPQRFDADASTVPGIFRPVVTPAEAGTVTMTLHLSSPDGSEVHSMGEFPVFATRAEADAAAPHEEEDPNEISYLLEQQWYVPFAVRETEARSIRPTFPAYARVTSPQDAQAVVAAPRAGRVVRVGGRFPRVGETVSEGDVVFQLTSAPQEATDQASVDLAVEQADIRVQSAQREVDRLTPLVAQGAVASRRLDEAQSALAEAQAELRSARRQRTALTQVERLDGSTDRLDVPAPTGGVVEELLVSPGEWVAAGQPLARLVDRRRVLLTVDVPEAYVGRIEEVSGAWFELPGVATPLEVGADELVSLGTELDAATRTLPVRFAIDNVRGDLFSGMRTQAHLIYAPPRIAAAVPVDAIIDDAGTDVVFVQTGGESFERRAVQLGARDAGFVEVADGVSVGEWVVGRGGHQVKLASMSTESVGHGHAH